MSGFPVHHQLPELAQTMSIELVMHPTISSSVILFSCQGPHGSARKECTYNAEDLGSSLGWEDPLEKGKATHSSVLAWRIPWTV